MNGSHDIFHHGRAEMMKRQWESIHDVVADGRRDDDLAGLSGLVDTRRNVDAIALQDSIFVDDIVDIDANAKMKREWILVADSALLNTLNVGRPTHRVHDAREFDQHGVARDLGDPSTVASHVRLHDLGPQRLPAHDGVDVLQTHEPGKAGDIGKGNGRKPPRNHRRCDGRRLCRLLGLTHAHLVILKEQVPGHLPSSDARSLNPTTFG